MASDPSSVKPVGGVSAGTSAKPCAVGSSRGGHLAFGVGRRAVVVSSDGIVTVDVEEGPVQYIAHHVASRSVVIAGAKTISVADTATGDVRSCRPSKRALSGVACATVEFPSGVTESGELKASEKMDIIVQSDRSGDAEAIPLHVTPENSTASRVLLGHTSAIITDVDVTPNDSHMFTCDREGKVRVSALPFAHRIQSYLLGHEKYVRRCIGLGGECLGMAVTGAGDATIRLWRIEDGECLAVHEFDWDRASSALSEADTGTGTDVGTGAGTGAGISTGPVAEGGVGASTSTATATATATDPADTAEASEAASLGDQKPKGRKHRKRQRDPDDEPALSSEPLPPCVFDISENPLAPGQFACLLTGDSAVYFFKVAIPSASSSGSLHGLVLVGKTCVAEQPLAVVHDAEGRCIVLGANAVAVHAVPPSAYSGPDSSPSWLSEVNKQLASAVAEAGELAAAPLLTAVTEHGALVRSELPRRPL